VVTGELILQPANGFPDSALQPVHDDLAFSRLINSRSIFCATGQKTRIRNISKWLDLKTVACKQMIVKFSPQNCENTLICAVSGI
jgi:hypothetical protein